MEPSPYMLEGGRPQVSGVLCGLHDGCSLDHQQQEYQSLHRQQFYDRPTAHCLEELGSCGFDPKRQSLPLFGCRFGEATFVRDPAQFPETDRTFSEHQATENTRRPFLPEDSDMFFQPEPTAIAQPTVVSCAMEGDATSIQYDNHSFTEHAPSINQSTADFNAAAYRQAPGLGISMQPDQIGARNIESCQRGNEAAIPAALKQSMPAYPTARDQFTLARHDVNLPTLPARKRSMFGQLGCAGPGEARVGPNSLENPAKKFRIRSITQNKVECPHPGKLNQPAPYFVKASLYGSNGGNGAQNYAAHGAVVNKKNFDAAPQTAFSRQCSSWAQGAYNASYLPPPAFATSTIGAPPPTAPPNGTSKNLISLGLSDDAVIKTDNEQVGGKFCVDTGETNAISKSQKCQDESSQPCNPINIEENVQQLMVPPPAYNYPKGSNGIGDIHQRFVGSSPNFSQQPLQFTPVQHYPASQYVPQLQAGAKKTDVSQNGEQKIQNGTRKANQTSPPENYQLPCNDNQDQNQMNTPTYPIIRSLLLKFLPNGAKNEGTSVEYSQPVAERVNVDAVSVVNTTPSEKLVQQAPKHMQHKKLNHLPVQPPYAPVLGFPSPSFSCFFPTPAWLTSRHTITSFSPPEAPLNFMPTSTHFQFQSTELVKPQTSKETFPQMQSNLPEPQKEPPPQNWSLPCTNFANGRTEKAVKATPKKQQGNRTNVKNGVGKKFPCTEPDCPKRFSKERELQVHINKHHLCLVKPYFCTYCSKSFKQSSNLTRHERIHTGEKPHQCVICGRPFARTDYRNTHYKKHKGVDKTNQKYIRGDERNAQKPRSAPESPQVEKTDGM